MRYLDNETLKGFLHIGTSSVSVFPQDIRSVSWSPDGKGLAYVIPAGGSLDIVIADQNGRGTRTALSLPFLEARMYWPSIKTIAFATPPSGAAEGYVFTYDLKTGALSKIAGPLFGLEALWSGDGAKVLLSFTNTRGTEPTLEVRDKDGVPLFKIGFSTLADKCAWSDSQEIFCAVPDGLPARGILPDMFLSGELDTSDTIYRFNLPRAEPSEMLIKNFDVVDLVISKNKKYLFFVDRRDGTLWRARLPQSP